MHYPLDSSNNLHRLTHQGPPFDATYYYCTISATIYPSAYHTIPSHPIPSHPITGCSCLYPSCSLHANTNSRVRGCFQGGGKTTYGTVVFATSLEEKMKQRNQERQRQEVDVGVTDESPDIIHVRILETEAILLLLQSTFHGLQRRDGDKTRF